jgi:serine/threonine protein kinase
MLGQLLNIGQLLDGRYRIVRILPAGGFGQTYVAEDVKRPGNPQCVVKQLRPLSNDPTTLQIARRLFKTEAETLEKLGRHDKIPQLLAYFEENQNFYLVQEFILGQTLAQILQQPLPEDRVINLLTEILEILVFVHNQKVIHRDIKPANLICRQTDSKMVMIDFGAVKELANQTVNQQGEITKTVTIGTVGYMPIEQFHGHPQFNSDIYALGIVAIQALTGLQANDLSKLRDPNNPSTGEIVWSHRVPHVKPELIDILNKMVRFDCRQRYQSANEVLNDLTHLSKKALQWKAPPVFFAGAALIGVGGSIFAFYNFYLQKFITQPQNSNTQILKTVKEKANRGDYQKSVPPVLSKSDSLRLNSQEAIKISLNSQVINSFLGTSNAVLPNNSYYKLYTFEGRANDAISIEMTSKEIDPSLILLDVDGNEIARNEDISPSNFNSRIDIKLPKDSVYVVMAISSQGKQSGTYRLQVGKSNF